MKKFLAAVIALMSVTATFVSCGKDESTADLANLQNSTSESSKADESSESEDATEESEETTEETTTTEATTTEETTTTTEVTTTEAVTTTEKTTAEPEVTTAKKNSQGGGNIDVDDDDADEYVALVADLMDSIIDGNYDETIELSFPNSTITAMKGAGMYDFFIDTFKDEMDLDDDDEYSYDTIEFVSIRNAEPDEYEESAEFYSSMEGIALAMIEADATYDALLSGELSDEQYEILAEDPFFTGEGGIIVEFDEYYFITCNVDDEEIEVPAFRQSDGVLKLDLAAMGF